WAQFLGQVRIEFWALVKNTTYIVVGVAALLNMVPSLILSATEGYGNHSFPVTYWVLDIIRGSLYLFVIVLVTYFAGVLIWKERDARADEIHDALPHPNWIGYVAKFVALLASLSVILVLALATGVSVQAWHKFTRFQFGLYLKELFILDYLFWIYLTFL